jgi:hypothetical protein
VVTSALAFSTVTPPSRGEFLPNATFPAVNSVNEYREGRRGVLAGDGGIVSKGFLVSAATVVVGALLAGALIQGNVANAGGDAGYVGPERLEDLVQGPPSPLHDSMEDVARRAMAMGEGWAGWASDDANSRVIIMWSGPIPRELVDLVGVTRDGVTVEVRQVLLSQVQIRKLADHIWRAADRGLIPRPVAVGPALDGQALEVEFDRSVLAKWDSEVLRGKLEGTIVDVPVKIQEGEAPIPTLGRQDGQSPFYAGSLMQLAPSGPSSPGSCSTGFAVTTSTGDTALLSARHCDTSGSLPWYTPAGTVITAGGTHVTLRGTNDTMLMNPAGSSAGWTYGAGWNATSVSSRFRVRVGGHMQAGYNEPVCTSGANSGEHCSTWVEQRYGPTVWTVNGFGVNGFTAASYVVPVSVVGGDSGGPVYINKTDGRVGARGIIYGGSGYQTCPSTAVSPNGNCFWTV